MAGELAIAMPTTEEMTRIGIVGASAGITGAVEGVVITMAPKMGALEVPFTWAALLGVPVIGAGVALMTKGMISDAGLGIAAGGTALLGRELPTLLEEFTLARAPRQIGGGNPGVKQLTGSLPRAPQRAQAATRSVGLEF